MYDLYDFDDRNYEQADRDLEEKQRWLKDALPWLRLSNTPVLEAHPKFPGHGADYDELAKFVEECRRHATVVDVPAKLTMGGFSVAVQVNFLNMVVYMAAERGLAATDLSGYGTLTFGSAARVSPGMQLKRAAVSRRPTKPSSAELPVTMVNGVLMHLSGSDVSRAIASLERADFPRQDEDNDY